MVSGRRIGVLAEPGLDFDPRSEPGAVGDDPHIAKVTFTTDAEDGVGYQGGGRAFRGGRGRGKYSWASERPARRLGEPAETPPQSAYLWTDHRTASRHADRAASRLSRVCSTLSSWRRSPTCSDAIANVGGCASVRLPGASG